jgi:phosphotransferase system enzyme I (PtsI)
LHGIGVSKGIAIGKVHLIERLEVEITEYCLTEQGIEEEVERLKAALEIAREQLRRIREHLPANTISEVSAFIDTYLLMLEDSLLTEVPFQLIREQRCNAEWALKLQCDKLVKIFDEMEDPYLSTRKNDVAHVVARVQRILRGHTELPNERIEAYLENTIIVADDLSPADTMLMQHHGVLAFITDYGGAMSHTAILARSLGIPAIVGVRQGRFYLHQGDTLIVDGFRGVVIVEPEESNLRYYRQRQREEKRYRVSLNKIKGEPTMTLDGTPITLHTNIEFPEDVVAVKRVGGDSVGLYRTEFLFMNRQQPPNEEEHLEAYLHVIRALKGGTVIIRTLDIGSDKTVASLNRSYDNKTASICNPALGLRAIRLCLRDPQLFKPQLRAILRASAQGQVRIMIPMISNLQEILQVKNMIQDIHRELEKEAIKFDPKMPFGVMVEVPAMALCMDLFAVHVDFLSIGTNDLTQYTLAIDRADDSVNHLYDPLHPAILRLIKMTIDVAGKFNKPVSMCGEMASDCRYIRLLLGLGLRTFSVNPGALLEVKQVINNSDIRKLTRLANKTLRTGVQEEILNLLDSMNS